MNAETYEYEYHSGELGNCPNCAEIIVREEIFQRGKVTIYWPCPWCGYTHYGETTPDLE